MSETRRRILFLTRLKESIEKDSYDEFVRRTLLPLVANFPSVISYDVYRIHGEVFQDDNEPEWNYIDVIDVEDVGAYEKDVAAAMEADLGREFEQGWIAMVDKWLPVYGSQIHGVEQTEDRP